MCVKNSPQWVVSLGWESQNKSFIALLCFTYLCSCCSGRNQLHNDSHQCETQDILINLYGDALLLSPGEIKASTMIMVSSHKTGSLRVSIWKVTQCALLFQSHSILTTRLVLPIDNFPCQLASLDLSFKLKLHLPINITGGLVSFLLTVYLLIDGRLLWCNIPDVILLPPSYHIAYRAKPQSM